MPTIPRRPRRGRWVRRLEHRFRLRSAARRIGSLSVLSGFTMLSTSCYIIDQGYHMVRNQVAAVPVENIRAGSTISSEESEFFQRVDAIRRYATQEVGLAAGDNYRSYVQYDRDYLVDVVSAVDELSFTRKEWRFPVVGSVPYKGFYDPENARKLARVLNAEGYDVITRPVTAFSTLGYFKDPLYSFMVSYDDARLSELLIHEMAHATVWVKGESQFNEEFATFVGRVGALEYMRHHFGPQSVQVADLLARRHDARQFREDVLGLRDQLKALYDSSTEVITKDDETGREELLTRKSAVIAAFQGEFDRTYHDRYLTDRYRFFVDATINNAWIDLYQTYSAGLHVFESYHAALGSDLRRTVETIVALMDGRGALPRAERPAPLEMLKMRIAEIELRSPEPLSHPNGQYRIEDVSKD